MCEEMRFPLGEAQRRLGRLEVQADAVGGPVDEGDELEAWLHSAFG